MLFPQQNPRPFTRTGIESLTPNQLGVYGLLKQGQWIYVGKGDIRQRLLDHLNGDNPCIAREAPTHFVAEVTPSMDQRERQLTLELQPTRNQRVG
jgi:hypothetical protein